MRTQNRPFRLTASAAIAAMVLAQALPQRVLAQGAPPPPPQAGVPDQAAERRSARQRVGRLAQLNGTVSFHPPDDQQWSAATLNYPVTQGDAFWTEPNARAVIEVSASRVAMAPATELDIGSLTNSAFQATAPQGELYLDVHTATPDESYAVQTPRGSDQLHRTGPLWRCGRRHPEPDNGDSGRRLRPDRGPRRFARCRARSDGEHHWHRHVPGRGRTGAARRVPHRDAGQRAATAAAGRRAACRGGSDARWRRPGAVRVMVRQHGIRTGLVSAGRAGLGTLPRGKLGLRCTLGLDLGRQRALGVRAVSLRPLGRRRRALGLGAGRRGGQRRSMRRRW